MSSSVGTERVPRREEVLAGQDDWKGDWALVLGEGEEGDAGGVAKGGGESGEYGEDATGDLEANGSSSFGMNSITTRISPLCLLLEKIAYHFSATPDPFLRSFS